MSKTTPKSIYILIQEQETGTDALGETYTVLGAYKSQAAADAAALDCRGDSCDEDRQPHRYYAPSPEWCSRCGIGFFVHTVPLT